MGTVPNGTNLLCNEPDTIGRFVCRVLLPCFNLFPVAPKCKKQINVAVQVSVCGAPCSEKAWS